MAQQIIECIPNFSEARRPEVIDAVLGAILSVPGVSILDRHSDTDHNRTVLTMIGKPQAVEEAAFQAIKKAQELIDLDVHEGAHPRIGATDVVPFVPIAGVSMMECVEIARRLGKRVGEDLGIPVYLYEEAASRPERQNLENIRKGQYEGLKIEIIANPDRKPDYGPARLGKAGATVIGARAPLIAFNIYLATTDVSIAQKIARAVRNSSGGLRYVKAMGILVDGLAQVSMNLTNYEQTPLARVVEMVRREAARYGVMIHHSELVGLIPQTAMVDAAVWYTQMDGFEKDQILENRLSEVPTMTQTEANRHAFLDELASENPTPGGGSAAAFTAAEAAALVAMVGRVTVRKKKYLQVEATMWEMIGNAEKLRQELTTAVKEDADAFTTYMQALRLPKNTPEEEHAREVELEKAAINAARVPHKVAGLALEVLRFSATAAEFGNINAISDAASAANLAGAAIRSAAMNVMINLRDLPTNDVTSGLRLDTERIRSEALDLETLIKQKVFERAGI